MATRPTGGVRLTLAVLLIVACAAHAQQKSAGSEPDNPQFRTWTDSTGEHRTEAAMVRFSGGKVYLKKKTVGFLPCR